jgi:hypothetical protein
MEEEPWRRNHGGGITWNHGGGMPGGIMEGELWMRNDEEAS